MANFIDWILGIKPKKEEPEMVQKAARRMEPFNLQLIGNTFSVYPYDQNTYLKKGYQGNSVIYGIVSKTARKASEVPGFLYKVKNKSKLARYQSLTKSYTADGLMQAINLKNQSLDEVPDTDAFFQLLKNPNPSQSEAQFRESIATMKMIFGGSPVYANMGKSKDNVYSVYSYPSPNVRLKPDNSLMDFERAYLQFNSAEVELPKEQLYYIRYVNPDIDITGKHLYGQSPMMAGLKNLKASNENVDYMAFSFETRGANGLFVPKTTEEADSTASRPGGADNARNTLDSLIANRLGSATARPYINMPLEYLSFGMNADELKVIEADELLTKGLARLYDFPLPLLSLESATDNNYQNAIKYLVSNTCYGHLCDYRDMVNNWLLPLAKAEGYYWDFDITAMPEMQGDIKALAEWLTKTDAITLNEVREALKYDRIDLPYMDEPLVSGSRKPVSLLDAETGNIEPNLL